MQRLDNLMVTRYQARRTNDKKKRTFGPKASTLTTMIDLMCSMASASVKLNPSLSST